LSSNLSILLFLRTQYTKAVLSYLHTLLPRVSGETFFVSNRYSTDEISARKTAHKSLESPLLFGVAGGLK